MTVTRTLTAMAALLMLAGCSAAQNVATDATDAAKDRAAAEASSAIASVVQQQICAVIGDNSISADDVKTLSGLLDQAEAAGVPADLLADARDVVEAGEGKATDVAKIQESCA